MLQVIECMEDLAIDSDVHMKNVYLVLNFCTAWEQVSPREQHNWASLCAQCTEAQVRIYHGKFQAEVGETQHVCCRVAQGCEKHKVKSSLRYGVSVLGNANLTSHLTLQLNLLSDELSYSHRHCWSLENRPVSCRWLQGAEPAESLLL